MRVRHVSLDSVCIEQIGTISTGFSGEIDYIDISSVSNLDKKIVAHQTLNAKDAPSRARQLIQKDDILVSTVRPNLNAVAIVEKDMENQMVASTGYCVLRCSSEIDKRYLFNFCQSPKFVGALTRQATGANYPAVSNSIVRSVQILLPSIDRQRSIASLLDNVSYLITLRKQQLAKLDELVKARFVEMFGDITLNDKNWPAYPLGELCEISRGGSPRPIEQFLGGTIPWIKIGDASVGDNIYLTSTKEYIIESGVKRSRLVKSGSLIFANCGVSLGFARIITFNGCIHDGWLAFENISDCLDKVFLLQSLNQMTSYFRKIAPAGTQPNLNTTIMKAYRQIVPPKELQQTFIKFVTQIDKSKLTIQQSLDKLEVLKKALMQKYFG